MVKCLSTAECNEYNILSRVTTDKPATNSSSLQDKQWREHTAISKGIFMLNWMTHVEYVKGILQHNLLTSRKITNYKMQIYK